MVTKMSLERKLNGALAHQKAGSLRKAELLYRQILKYHPKHFDALHFLGTIFLQKGMNSEALQYISEALKYNPTAFIALNNQGLAFQMLGRYDEALESYAKATAIQPDYEAAYKHQADLLQAIGRHHDAICCYDRIITLNPKRGDYFNNRGISLQALGRHIEALENYNTALAFMPNSAAVYNNTGDSLRLLGRYDDALIFYSRAIELEPHLIAALNNYGSILHLFQRYRDALSTFDRILEIAPDHSQVLNNRGAVLRDLSRSSEALTSVNRALAVNPNFVEALVNRGTIYHEQGQYDKALHSFSDALKVDHDSVDAHWNRSLSLLAAGYLSTGFEEYEWRWKRKQFTSPPRDFSQPKWTGEAVSAGAIRVWGEQGVGDEILYGAMVGTLRNRGYSVIFEADNRLVALFQRSYPGMHIIPRQSPPHPSTFEDFVIAQISSGSLGKYVLRDSSTFSDVRRAYLHADRDQVLHYRRSVLASAKTRLVGVSWRSSNAEFGNHKSIQLRSLAPIWQAVGPETSFVDLQYGNTTEERELAGLDLVHLERLDLQDNIDGVAALISACDIVITVSNTIAHLAGALGVPVWVIAPGGIGKLWYWGIGPSATPWYPSAVVFRRNASDSWDDVIARVALRLSTEAKDAL